MAEIDYAFLAEFARVDPNGTLTTIGASFTFMSVPGLPMMRRIAIAGRVRAHVNEVGIPLQVSVTGPGNTFKIVGQAVLSPGPGARPYGGGTIGHLFALEMDVPLITPGLYTFEVEVPEAPLRRLAFEVDAPPPGV